jgi:surface polysaccharide O-acyltransferase-like enzyme
MNQNNRMDFFDGLRAFTIFLVIIMHTAMTFLGFSNWVHNTQSNNAVLGLIAVFVESGVWMPILFFISGYFTLPSLQKRGPQAFLKDKLVRVGLPFLIGLSLLSPVLWLMGYYSEGGGLPPAQVLGSFFTLKNYSQFHFWYLGVLLLYFGLVALACKRFPGMLKAAPSAARPPSAIFFTGLVAITSLLCFGVNLFLPYGGWTCIGILQFQPVKAPLYTTYFLLGIYAYLKGWFKGGYQPRLWPWAALYALSFIFYLGLTVRTNGAPSLVTGKLLMNTTASIEVLSALLSFSALFQKLFNGERPWLRSLSSLSFTAYIVHLNVLFVIVLLTRDLALAVLVKYALQAGSSVVIAWGISALWRQMTQGKGVRQHAPRVMVER